MAKQTINIGTVANDGTGDVLRVGGDKTNDNFNEVYSAIGDGSDLKISVSGATNNQVLKYSNANSRFEAGDPDIVTDTTPQLGGNLDVNGNSIISASNGNIVIAPDGTGRVSIDGLIYPNADGSTGQFLKTDGVGNLSFGTVTTTFNISDDSSTVDSFSTGSTLKFTGGNGITTSVGADEVTIAIDGAVVTETSSDTLTNKDLTSNTNTFNPITIADNSSTTTTIGLGETLKIAAGNGVSTSISGDTISIAATGITTNELSATANIANSQLTNSTITLGSTSIALGSNSSSLAGVSLSGTGNVDLSGTGSIIRVGYSGTGSFPNATTYNGAYVVDTSADKPYFASSNSYIQIMSENSSVGLLSDVNITSPAILNKQTIVFNGTQGRFNAGYATTSAVFDVSANGSTAYTFEGDGFSSASDNPTLYLKKGHTYVFNMNASGHPFRIQSTTGTGGTAYNDGVTNNSAETTDIIFTVDMSAPATLYYQCTNHAAMNGTINIS